MLQKNKNRNINTHYIFINFTIKIYFGTNCNYASHKMLEYTYKMYHNCISRGESKTNLSISLFIYTQTFFALTLRFALLPNFVCTYIITESTLPVKNMCTYIITACTLHSKICVLIITLTLHSKCVCTYIITASTLQSKSFCPH